MRSFLARAPSTRALRVPFALSPLRSAAAPLRRGATSAPPPAPPAPFLSPLARALLATAVALPLGAAVLVVHGTSVGKIYRDSASSASEFLLREAPLEPALVAALRAEALRLVDEVGVCKRYNFPPGKAGSTVPYKALREHSPVVCKFYEEMAERVSAVVGERVVPTPPSDNSSCSILVYAAHGDQIDWHYDLNFYCGRHFTVLVPLLVEGPVDAQLQVVAPLAAQLPRERGAGGTPVVHASASQETVKAVLGARGNTDASGNAFANATIEVVPTVEGRGFVVFEGEKVFHRVTPMGASTTPWVSSWAPPQGPPSGTTEALQPKLRALGALGAAALAAAEGAASAAVGTAKAAAGDAASAVGEAVGSAKAAAGDAASAATVAVGSAAAGAKAAAVNAKDAATAAVGSATAAARAAAANAKDAVGDAALEAAAAARASGVRVVLSMTFTTDPTATPLSIAQRRLKDMVYFGPLQALFG